jgi:hypothetical protein
MVDGVYFSLGMEKDYDELGRRAEIYKNYVKQMLKLTD